MPSTSLFAWEGFSFRHPEDWAPVTLSGNRAEGYVRLQGSGRIGCQIRWKRVKHNPHLAASAQDYFRLLERDSKRAKSPFKVESEMDESGRISYRWVGSSQGRGMLFVDGNRIFFLEVTGGRTDSILPQARELFEHFGTGVEVGLEPWSLFGMTIRLPKGMSPTSKLLQAGRTGLTFSPRGATIEAVRFAFGKELMSKHRLEDWARAALRMPHAGCVRERSGLRMTQKHKIQRNVAALVGLDESKNQIVAIRSATNQAKWTPRWDWLASEDS